MQFYEVLGDGYHTPLTRTQVEGLFQAGRIGRQTPCKQVENTIWKTVDELFPLLKYDSSGWRQSQALRSESRNSARVVIACALIAAAITAWIYLGFHLWPGEQPSHAEPPVVASIVRPAAGVPQMSANTSQTLWNGYSRAEPRPVKAPRVTMPILPAPERAPAVPIAAVPSVTPPPQVPAPSQRNVVVPLDVFTVVNDVGGLPVTIKVRDVDVTSIDVWTNQYAGPVRLTKQKGISGTGTDETLIYQSGRARVYYVWEISGTLNHCLLRVREG